MIITRELFDPEVRLANFRRWLAEQAQPQCFYRDEQCCGAVEHVRPMTLYGDEPEHYVMCSRHADEYREHWTEQWRDYYAGVL